MRALTVGEIPSSSSGLVAIVWSLGRKDASSSSVFKVSDLSAFCTMESSISFLNKEDQCHLSFTRPVVNHFPDHIFPLPRGLKTLFELVGSSDEGAFVSLQGLR